MNSSGFEPSVIVGIVIGLAFLALFIAVIVKMARKKPGVSLTESSGYRRSEPTPEPPPSSGKDYGKGKLMPAGAQPTKGALPKAGSSKTEPLRAGSVKGEPVKVEPVKIDPSKEFKTEIQLARHLTDGLARTRKEGFVARLLEAFKKGSELDDTLVGQAEEALLTADIGVKTAMELTEALRKDFKPGIGALAPQVMRFLKEQTRRMLTGQVHGMPALDAAGLNIVMVVGVNGTGKTTSIAKLANYYRNQGKRVLLAAGDTFRAAGADQLGIWGDRIGIPVVVGKPGQDPSSLFFDAARRAIDEGFDVMIADTAGRLHTDMNLVDELKKVHRVLGKAVPGAPHEVMLMLDSTMGQNAVKQADVFLKSVQVTGIGLSKLDGTARGGVVISIARDMNLPIWFVGIGEAIDDIRSFDADQFVDALFSVD
jgi:fused signal recognition particle receptor